MLLFTFRSIQPSETILPTLQYSHSDKDRQYHLHHATLLISNESIPECLDNDYSLNSTILKCSILLIHKTQCVQATMSTEPNQQPPQRKGFIRTRFPGARQFLNAWTIIFVSLKLYTEPSRALIGSPWLDSCTHRKELQLVHGLIPMLTARIATYGNA